MENIVFENSSFILKLNEKCCAESLIVKETGEECISNTSVPFFSLTEERLYNNELKLSYPNKRTVFSANRVRLEDGKLIVGFELIHFEAVVSVKNADNYIAFTIEDFVTNGCFDALCMTPPPVAEFRLIQLSVIKKSRFGQWLNVVFDDKSAVNVLATSPYAKIDSEECGDFRLLTADAVRGIKLKGCTAAIIAAPTEKLLDAIEQIETDYNLPSGVKSRRSDAINSSIYWVYKMTPENIDWHIAQAKKGGFELMLLYYPFLYSDSQAGYIYLGEYKIESAFKNIEGISAMLDKIKNAGILPGLHILHSFIGLKSKYVSPSADSRLNLTRRFTLSKKISCDDTTIFVEENPENCVMHEKCRVLKFDGELIHYDSYTTEYPYSFNGCSRGYADTDITEHAQGTIGGILDISEFGAESVYIDQNTSLQDEVADSIAKIYNAGFRFMYFDGAEGTNAPFEFHIPNAQYRVYKKLKPEPLFSESSANSHFSWHMSSGGNAFDIFPTNIFKEKIVQFPLEEAERIKNDFTRVNFGWWMFFPDTQPDTYEYGMSKAAAFDCPATVQASEDGMMRNPRTNDILEVVRRWEYVRKNKLLTPEQKDMLKNPNEEYTLISDGNGGYELAKYERIDSACGKDERIAVYVFEKDGRTCAVLWHTSGSGVLKLPVGKDDITYLDEMYGNTVPFEFENGCAKLEVSGKKYITTKLAKDDFISSFHKAVLE